VVFIQPRDGWRAWFQADTHLRIYQGGQWQEHASAGTLLMLGINTTADATKTNRLTVNAAATLFNNAGNGHQIKVNKQALADAASLQFQTNWSARAEMGIGGSDDFVIKVRPDGYSWLTGLQVSSKGVVTTPSRLLARA
jgi:hypothetical protein